MKKGKHSLFPLVFIPTVVIILAIVGFADELDKQGMMLPAIYLLMVSVALILFATAIRDWRKPAEEILKETQVDIDMPGKKMTKEQRIRNFFILLLFAAFVGVRSKSLVGPLMVTAVNLINILPLVGQWIRKKQGREGEPFFTNSKIKPIHIVYALVSLAGEGFFCFLGYQLVIHKIWFMMPVVLGFMFLFLRPVGAVVQILVRESRNPGTVHIHSDRKRKTKLNPQRRRHIFRFGDPGAKHVNPGRNRGVETDPWDRPDREYTRHK